MAHWNKLLIQPLDMLTKLAFLIITIQAVLCQHESVSRCARAAKACLLAPQAMEGPYYWNSTVRQDITESKPGTPLRLSITVLNTNTCSPIRDALVDIWHCDALGVYSHFVAASAGNMNAGTDASTFFRGQQMTNANGLATFKTVYPGWYRGRATHIHVKVHIGSSLNNIGGAIYTKGGHVSHTGQFFFDDAFTDTLSKVAPYKGNTNRRTRNNEDDIYLDEGGATTVLPVKLLGSTLSGGTTTEITLGVDPTATPAPVGFDGRPPPNGARPPGPPPTGERPPRPPPKTF